MFQYIYGNLNCIHVYLWKLNPNVLLYTKINALLEKIDTSKYAEIYNASAKKSVPPRLLVACLLSQALNYGSLVTTEQRQEFPTIKFLYTIRHHSGS